MICMIRYDAYHAYHDVHKYRVDFNNTSSLTNTNSNSPVNEVLILLFPKPHNIH